jgi:hypothetical protein
MVQTKQPGRLKVLCINAVTNHLLTGGIFEQQALRKFEYKKFVIVLRILIPI